MELREDEIEALLGFDGASLQVVKNEDLLAQANQPYSAIIYINAQEPDPCIARGGESRIAAVRAAWQVYTRFKETPLEERENGYWLYEQALSRVTQIVSTQQTEKQNG